MNLKRVVVTGIGALTPIGNTKDEFWKGLANGVSGAAPITRFDASLFKTQFACEIKNFDVEKCWRCRPHFANCGGCCLACFGSIRAGGCLGLGGRRIVGDWPV